MQGSCRICVEICRGRSLLRVVFGIPRVFGVNGFRWCFSVSQFPSCGFSLERFSSGRPGFLPFLRPGRDQKRGNCSGQVDRELGMARSKLGGVLCFRGSMQ